MSEFKLIAIKTGDSLTKEESLKVDPNNWVPKENYNYIKNLEPNKEFLFFKDYSISDDSNLLTHHSEESIPHIYKLDNNPKTKIEISAIVGRNGSGKSSLIEILYLAIHNLAVQLDILYDSDKNLVIEPQTYLRCELFILVDNKTSYKIKFHFDDLKRECYLFKSKKIGNKFKFKDTPDELKKEDLSSLFYTISVNYSIYGLNSLQIGSWINHLFHKNDSYQTPLVINPMRTNGNFDINRENHLFKYRLLYNSIMKYSISKNDVEIIENIKLKELIFKLNRSKVSHLESEKEYFDRGRERVIKERTIKDLLLKSELDFDLEQLIEITINSILGRKYIKSKKIVYEKEVQLYIIKKLYRIAFNYSKYWKYLDYGSHSKPIKFETNFSKKNFNDYLNKLKDDHTHITLKLRQALNYLFNDPLCNFINSDDKIKYWLGSSLSGEKIYKIPFGEFAGRLLEFPDNIINCLPPSLFNIVINVSRDNSTDSFDINQLSSGQLQLIQSIQSSIYHINNLESYQKSTHNSSVKYKNILLVFDEIELYFHPEYQRNIISHFIWELDQIKLNLIKSLHILYITHSPFVLSDIPHINQLNLKEGSPASIKDKTFSANIYELLQDSFYLESPIGAYAEKIIDELLVNLNKILEIKESGKDKKILRTLRKKENKEIYFKTINLIGDRIVRNKLLDMYEKCFDINNETKEEVINFKINQLKQELKNLKND